MHKSIVKHLAGYTFARGPHFGHSPQARTTECGKIKDHTAQNALLCQWFWIFLPNFQALFLEQFTAYNT